MFSANSSQVSEDRLYVEDVFSTYLYTGNSSTQTITNGIDLAGKGGLVWQKGRSGTRGTGNNYLFDTSRGALQTISSNTTEASYNRADSLTAFNSNGFTLGSNAFQNETGSNFASWTFRKAPKFFDVVTYTGNGAENRVLSHALGSVPGTMIIKRTDSTGNWDVWHRAFSYYLGTAPSVFCMGRLEETTQFGYSEAQRLGAAPTSTSFTLGPNVNGAPLLNASGATYVAYLFAHDTTSDGIIQCGSYTGNGSTSGPVVNLGWEPQWLLVKNASSAVNWYILDNMRGWPEGKTLFPNLSNAESASLANGFALNATGFQPTQSYSSINASGNTYIYIAIRRGPMRAPTSGTSVFSPIARTGTGGNTTVTSVGFPPDMVMSRSRNNGTGIGAFGNMTIFDRLRGVAALGSSTPYLFTSSPQQENTVTNGVASLSMNGYELGADGNIGTSNYSIDENYINYSFRRAPSFFDEVCWTNTGATQNVNHNLGVVPELIITKRRSADENWQIYSAPTGASAYLNFGNLAVVTGNTNRWNATSPTSTTFTTGSAFNTAANYVAYLFASCPGVSKVGSYTGNGSTQTINCGFTNGARFVLIKRVDNSGSWFVWDTARGITSGNDPFIRLDSSSAEGGDSYNSIDPSSNGFIVIQSDAAQININGATYIYLAVA